MPKLFPLNLEVEEIAVGRVMRLLQKMDGVVKVNLDLDQPEGKPNGKAGNPRKQFDVPGKDVLFKLVDRGIRRRSEIAKHFQDLGRSPQSISSIIYEAQQQGLLVSKEDGYHFTKKMRDRMRSKK